ncbi:type II toxin-antitoxin system RelE/ParE family toxin [Lacticaseibacillus pabuli]|uniref:type II toxin-antitoxin system RelE/ParE family toxin n=1 Tax=Lacticaseibacillus pabuli TaxID=3025672 RepID=UPI003AF32993
MACDIQLKNAVIRYLKKIKERKLKERFVDLIYTTIADDPESGDAKTGDFSGIYTMGFRYQKTEYRVAYMISPPTTVIVLLAGSHEDFEGGEANCPTRRSFLPHSVLKLTPLGERIDQEFQKWHR